jgi:hypothetical protein
VDFSNPGLSPAHWTLTLRPDGSGHFRSERGSGPGGLAGNRAPGVDRDIQVSAEFAARVFQTARAKVVRSGVREPLEGGFPGMEEAEFDRVRRRGELRVQLLARQGDSSAGRLAGGRGGNHCGGRALELLLRTTAWDWTARWSTWSRPGRWARAADWRHPGDSGAAGGRSGGDGAGEEAGQGSAGKGGVGAQGPGTSE